MFNPSSQTRPPAHRCVLAAYLVAAALPLACGATAAAAADMPVKAKPAAAPPYQWTGCYVGLNGGVGAGSSNFTTGVDPGTYLAAGDAAEVTNDGAGSANNSNFLGGAQAGCNWQTGTIVAGLEGDFDYFPSHSAFYNDTNVLPVAGVPFVIGQSLKSDYFDSIRPRLGIGADRNFAYLTGGAAFTKANYTEGYSDGAGGVGIATGSRFLTGWTAGVGWEHAWTDHWTFRFEYLYAAFPTTSANGVITGPGGSNALHGSANLALQILRAGVNYKF
jgi:outer membrane immunogenic protein